MEVKVWSTGEPYKQSTKNQKPLLNSKNEIIHNVAYRGEYNIKKNDKINEIKRDEIMDRRMSIQTFQNPFLHKSYNDVLADQEKYLMPHNSLINKEPPNLQ
jgi:ribosome recycling factor